MSEGTAREITCRVCSKNVSSLGNFCMHCGSKINVEQTGSTGGEGDGPHPPIQVSDASSSSSSGTGTKPLSQQSDLPVVGVSPTNNSGSHQSNISTVPTSTGTTTTSTATETSSYADKVRSSKQNAPQNQQANGSLAGDVTTSSDPRMQDSRHRNAREGSRAANGAPENGGNSLYEDQWLPGMFNVYYSGITPSDVQRISVNFHVIIPVSIWDWNDYCRLAITLGQQMIFSRQQCHWDKYNAVEVTAHAYLPSSYVNKKVPYKYVVQYGNGYSSYQEYIHDLPVKDTCNRCLELGNRTNTEKGVHHVYDGFIFPTQKWHEKILSYIKMVNINTKESHGYALLIYLQSKKLTANTAMTGSAISDLLKRACKIYFQLNEKNYMYSDEKKGCLYFKCTEQLHKGLQKWFVQTIEYLGNYQSAADEKRVWSASIVMALVTIMRITEIRSLFDVNAFQVMFTYLCLEKNQREHIVGLMETPLRGEVASGIAYVCSLSIAHGKTDSSCQWHWLYAIPLLHQLQSQDGITDDHMTVDPDNVDWGINGLDKDKLKDFKCLVQSKRMMKILFAELGDHMKSDHLLLRLLVYLSTEDDVDVILDNAVHVPVHIFALHISNQCQQYDKLCQKKFQSQKMCHALEKMCQCTAKCVDEKKHWFYCTMVAAKRILVKLAKICATNSPDSIYWSIKLCLVALNSCTSKSDGLGDNVSNYIIDVQGSFMTWFQSTEFGECFGGKGGKMIKNEIKLWNNLLTLDSSFQLLPCISNEWKSQMKQIIHNRMHSKQLSISTKVDTALEICNSNEIDSTFSDTVWESIAEAMENDALMKKAQDVIDNKSDKSNTGVLLSRLLINYYAVKEINLATLLSFCLWPEYLKHFVSNDKLAQSYSEECTKKCTEACDYVLSLIDKLKTGFVTVEELHMVNSHTLQVVKLFSIVTKDTASPEFSQTIAQRMSELEKFNLHYNAIKVLLKCCEDISEDDLIEDLQDNLRIIDSKEQFSKLKISELYEEIDGNEVYALLDINDVHVVEMLQPFVVMMEECKNVIFDNIWYYHNEMEGSKLSLSEIATDIWAPCFKEIQQLVEKFCDRSVSLQEIDQYLKNVSLSDLNQVVFKLVQGCNKCLNSKASTTWVTHFVDSVRHYRIIDKAKDVADLVIAAKDVLKMSNGFEKLEDCKAKMSGQTELSLEEFEQEGYNFEELEVIASDDNKVEFLNVLSTSQQLIDWLRRETKDVTELHNLVGLSILENNVGTMGRIARLHTVGSAIASLVYELDPDSGLCGFLEACEPVWKAIEVNPQLPSSFKACCDELSFLKLIKDLQAPIEVNTYDQIRDILESGKIQFGSKRFRIFNSTEEIIKLRVTNSTSSKQKYTLTELQELESKIVLIRDHRSSSEKLSSREIEDFLNILHFALHIADTFLHLQQAGHPQYVEWLKSFDIQTVSQKDLQILNRDMKKDLQDWLNRVSKLRREYYALNYFTCLQLLRINREFYNLINSNDHQISRKVFLLLLSLSPDLTTENIRNVVSAAKFQLVSPESMSLSSVHDDRTHIIDIPDEVSKLTEEERELYHSCITDYEFEPSLALAAIRKCGANEDDVVEWCLNSDNQKMFRNTSKDESFNAELNKLQIIDRNNATVQELMDLEFSEDLSIEAVKLYGEDLTQCMEYCSDQILAKSDSTSDDENISLECVNSVYSDVEISESDEELSDTEGSPLSDNSTSEETAKYFDLKALGFLLDELAAKFPKVQSPRRFIKCFEKGTSNFLSVPSCDVFKIVISIYAQDKLSFLPLLEEILICNERTTVEEISLLWYRAARDPGYRRIFCLVNGEKLPYQVCVKALELMDEILKEITDYRLVIICSNDAKDRRSYIMDHLQFFHRDAMPVNLEDKVICNYLNHHVTSNREFELEKEISASDVDPDRSAVRVIRSERAGMGKSLYISRLTEKLEEKLNESNQSVTYSLCVTIPVHGPTVNYDEIMKSLRQHSSNFADLPPQIFHFDIASSVLNKVDALLFSLLVLKGFNDGCGNVWRCFSNQLYLVEVTYESPRQDEESGDVKKYCSTTEFLKLIPTTMCCSPKESLRPKSLSHGMWTKTSSVK